MPSFIEASCRSATLDLMRSWSSDILEKTVTKSSRLYWSTFHVTQYAFLPFSLLIPLIPMFDFFCISPRHHRTIQYLIPGRTTNVELLNTCKIDKVPPGTFGRIVSYTYMLS